METAVNWGSVVSEIVCANRQSSICAQPHSLAWGAVLFQEESSASNQQSHICAQSHCFKWGQYRFSDSLLQNRRSKVCGNHDNGVYPALKISVLHIDCVVVQGFPNATN